MSPLFQTIAALALVAIAAGGLLWRSFARRGRHHGGCGSCPTDKFKVKIK